MQMMQGVQLKEYALFRRLEKTSGDTSPSFFCVRATASCLLLLDPAVSSSSSSSFSFLQRDIPSIANPPVSTSLTSVKPRIESDKGAQISLSYRVGVLLCETPCRTTPPTYHISYSYIEPKSRLRTIQSSHPTLRIHPSRRGF